MPGFLSLNVLRSALRSPAALACVLASLLTSPSQAGLISGQAFVDYDGNGTVNATEYGIPGITVTAYTPAGTSAGSTTTLFTGTYSLNASGSGPYRVEFSSIPSYLSVGFQGASGNSEVRFVQTSTASNLNLPLIDPVKYNTAVSPPTLVTQFLSGPANGTHATKPGLLRLPYTSSGHDFTDTTPSGSYQATSLATFQNIGATYALAHQTTRNRLYVAAYHKRHSGFGPEGPDAIYVFDSLTGTQLGTLNLDSLTALSNSTGSDVHNFTPTSGQIYDLGSNNNANSESFDGVGKRAFGDMEMSADMKTLYLVNLFDRKIYALDVSSGIPAQTTLIQSWSAPDATTANRHRPFALAVHQGRLWIGSVDENGSNAFVHSFLPSGPTPTFTLELTLPLNYPRQAFIGAANNPNRLANWRAWATTASSLTPLTTNNDEIAWPQPILSDIEFNGRHMLLGLRDRFGDQAGYAKRFNLASTTDALPISAGDLLLVCRTETGWAIEGSPNCPNSGGLVNSGPGGAAFAEHYEWDLFNDGSTWDVQNTAGGLHWETTQGALLQLAGKSTVMTTAMNTFSDFSGGLLRLENTTGRREGINSNSAPFPTNGAYTLYEGGDYLGNYPADTGYFNEANGLGAIEPLLSPPPIQIGNRIWLDSNVNGIQDANENGIENVSLSLYDATGALVATTQTATSTNPDLKGTFAFSNLSPDTTYTIAITPSALLPGGALAGLRRTQTAAGTSSTDSDAILLSGLTGGLAPLNGLTGLTFTTGPIGISNQTLDLGFISCPAITLSPSALPRGRIGESYAQTFTASAAGPTVPYTFSLLSGTPPAGITLAPSGLLDGTPTTPGLTTFTVLALDPEGCLGTRSVDLRICPNIALTPTSLPTATHQSPYSVTFTASGGQGPYTFALASGTLPPGLTLVNGTLSGTPTGPASTTPLILQGLNANGCDGSIQLTLTVTAATLTGSLYLDTNASGTRDLTEPGLPNIDLLITSSVNGYQQTISTNASGLWTALVPPGDNTVTVVTTDPDFPLGATQTQGTNPTLVNAPGGQSTPVAALGFLPAKPTTWPAWQYRNPLGGQNAPTDNPDGDPYDNLQEFAFCSPPNSGLNPRCPVTVTHDPATGLIDVRILRLTGASGITYTLETLTDIAQSPAAWTDVTTLPTTVTYNPDGTEWATYANIAPLAPTSPSQFFRIRLELDADFNGTAETTSYTETAGYYRRTYGTAIETLCIPFLSCNTFAGKIDSVIGQTLSIASSIATGDFTTTLTIGVPYYIEVLVGDHAGHRFEVNETASLPNAIAIDTTSPLNTLPTLPATLAADRIAVRRHHTLDSFFHKPHFNATNDPATAARVLFFESGNFRTYWLFRAGGNPYWVQAGDNLLRNVGTRIIPPSEGLYVNPRSSTPTLTLTGKVRSTPFVTPLLVGPNLIAGGWPMTQSPTQRAYTASSGLTGSLAPASSDRLLFWLGDTTPAASGYDGHFLFRSGTVSFWTTEQNSSFINENNLPLLKPLRATLLRSKIGLPTHTQPNPWTP